MRRRHICFLLCLGAMVVQASTFMASAADFTCQVYGGSFVLDDTDFKAMTDSTSITKETFASRRGSALRSTKVPRQRSTLSGEGERRWLLAKVVLVFLMQARQTNIGVFSDWRSVAGRMGRRERRAD